VTASWLARKRLGTAWGAVAVAGVLGIAAHWLERWRPPSPDRLTPFVFRVTTASDGGSGSLRDALTAADRTASRARIVIAVPRIALETPLPPIVNPFGVVLESQPGGAEIEAAGVPGAVLDVVSAATTISDIRIRGGVAGIVVRARGTTLRHLTLTGSETGVLIADGAGDATIADSSFSRNRIGIQITARDGRTTVRNSRFEHHLTAAIWAVTPPASASSTTAEVAVLDSHFRDDAAGVVIVNETALLERNVFDDQRGSAIHASDARVALGNNRIHGGRGFGIYAERLSSGLVSGNEISHNCAGGLLLRQVSNTRVISNQVYQNGYGLVMMQGVFQSPNTVADNLFLDHVGDGIVLIAASPILNGNRIMKNHLAGLRLSSMGVARATVVPAPLLTDNLIQGNGHDELQRDEYDAGARGTATGQPLTDCVWRTGSTALAAMQVAQVRP
jgi:Right handed beta helix region